MTRITSAIAATLIASASFAGAAMAAEGKYYEGVAPRSQQNVVVRNHSALDYGYTGSISNASRAQHNEIIPVPNRGDYYEGVNRPN